MNPPATDATLRKREQLAAFTNLKLVPHPSVQAVVAYGSLANGTARDDSDLDAYVFMDPIELYLVPAESIWRPRDDTFHSIFSDDPSLEREGLQLDLSRVDLTIWRDSRYQWPELVRAQLAGGWVVFDRHGEITRLITERTRYPDHERRRVLDESVVSAAGELGDGEVTVTWQTLGPAEASDRLQAAYESLADALFAYNRRWRPPRNRQMRELLRLPWLPAAFDCYIMDVATSRGHDIAAYQARAAALRRLLNALVDQFVADGIYQPEDPISQAFIRSHEEPGRAWNMTAWNRPRRRAAADDRPTENG